MKEGIQLIAEERQQQKEKHGYSLAKDLKYNSKGQLSTAASLLAVEDITSVSCVMDAEEVVPEGWDLDLWQKMWDKPYQKRLVIAGALIAAEIDRLQHI